MVRHQKVFVVSKDHINRRMAFKSGAAPLYRSLVTSLVYKILLLVWSRTVTVLVCTYMYTVIIIFFLLEGWLTTLRKLSIKGCVWEGNVPPSARSAKLKVIHGLK